MINRFIYIAASRLVAAAEENESWQNGARDEKERVVVTFETFETAKYTGL